MSGWHPITPTTPPEFRTVYLYRAGDLCPAVRFLVSDQDGDIWTQACAGEEDGDHQTYDRIGGEGWKPTHWREIEDDLPLPRTNTWW